MEDSSPLTKAVYNSGFCNKHISRWDSVLSLTHRNQASILMMYLYIVMPNFACRQTFSLDCKQ